MLKHGSVKNTNTIVLCPSGKIAEADFETDTTTAAFIMLQIRQHKIISLLWQILKVDTYTSVQQQKFVQLCTGSIPSFGFVVHGNVIFTIH